MKICVRHKGLRKYLDTVHYVVKKQLTKDLKIRDPFVAEKVENQLRDYRKAISELEGKLDFFTVKTVLQLSLFSFRAPFYQISSSEKGV